MTPISVERARRLTGLAVALGRTWRFRDVDDPRAPGCFPDTHAIFATWHEYIAGYALLGRGRGLAALASLNRDGEIVTHVLTGLGFDVIRGSTSRGAAAGYREMIRAVEAGASICLTTDGPRGPRHVCQAGTVRLAARTGRPIVPMALAATSYRRLRSWDRFLVPGPGARVLAAFGDPIRVTPEADVEAMCLRIAEATTREARRAETVANEMRWGHADRTRPLSSLRGDETPAPAAGGAEARARRAWTGRAPLDLRLASAVYVAVREARHALYDTGVFTAHPSPVPVISIGGLTVGGSGKTPLASEVAGWLLDAGRSPAVLGRGYVDELRLHGRLRPNARVWGHPDRACLARRAASEGADVVILDDGLQHRRLARDLDVVAVDRDALRRTNRRALPAGPFRESLRRLRRGADRIVLLGREPRSAEVAEWEAEWVAEHAPQMPVAIASFEHEAPRLARSLDAEATDGPVLALTGIMKPNLFFDFVREACPTVVHTVSLPDHGLPDEWDALLGEAAGGGIVTTLKDYMRFETLIPDDLPVWYVAERIVWHEGEPELRESTLRLAGER